MTAAPYTDDARFSVTKFMALSMKTEPGYDGRPEYVPAQHFMLPRILTDNGYINTSSYGLPLTIHRLSPLRHIYIHASSILG